MNRRVNSGVIMTLGSAMPRHTGSSTMPIMDMPPRLPMSMPTLTRYQSPGTANTSPMETARPVRIPTSQKMMSST